MYRVNALRSTLLTYCTGYIPQHWTSVYAHVLPLLNVLVCPLSFCTTVLAPSDTTRSVDEAFDFLIKDMGEDRWLCTLLVQEGNTLPVSRF